MKQKLEQCKQYMMDKMGLQMLLCFILALLPRLIVALQSQPVRTISDEVASIAAGAYYAGYDWSEVIQHAGYYGTGFYALFTWIFWLTDDPVIIYRTILAGCAIVQALVVPVCYGILRYIFEIKSTAFVFLVSLLSSFCVETRTSVAYNEHPLILLSWLFALLLLLQYKHQGTKKEYLYALGAMLVLGYGYTVHIRFLIVAIAACVAWVLFYLLSGKRLFRIWYVPVVGVAYLLARIYIQYIQGNLWRVAEGESIRNMEISIATSVDLFSWNGFWCWFKIVAGQLTTMNVAMLGLFIFAIVMVLVVVCRVLYQSIKKRKRHWSKENQYILILFLVAICCVGGTILGQSFSWLDGVAGGLLQDIRESGFYSYKAFTYIRYAAPYVGVLIFSGLVACYYYRDLIRRAFLISTGFSIVFSAYFIGYILPYIKQNGNAVEAFIPWSSGWTIKDAVNEQVYLQSFIFLGILTVIGLLLVCWKKHLLYWGVLLVLLVVQFHTIFQNRDLIMQSNNEAKVQELYEVMKELPDGLTIYSCETDGISDHQIYYLHQLYLNRQHIVPELPEQVGPDTIILSNASIRDRVPEELTEYELGFAQYVYVGEKYRAVIEEAMAGVK